jgi:trans-2,3-dihydro-3-hydroxyanthranilate isomerase
MRQRQYLIYDVFTHKRLAGNPLAVVMDGDGLDTDAMQAIAREFNLSETVFVMPARDRTLSARIRIFTPTHEMPFAGHPTVGTAVALAEHRGRGAAPDGPSLVVLEEKIGVVRCAVTHEGEAAFAEFDLPQLPQALAHTLSPEAVGAALGLDAHEIGFENHRVGLWSAGVPYVTVPVAGLETASRARIDGQAWRALAPVRDGGVPAAAYVYCRETVSHECAFHARMFVPGPPSWEDPATGSAAAAFAGAIVAYDQPVDGPSRIWIEQGIEMGRPSEIRLEIEVASSAITAARIGGHAVQVAEGMLGV